MQRNNLSRKYCKEFAEKNKIVKETYRNVITINGNRWAFCVNDHNNHRVSCRQTYEDCIGFISYDPIYKNYKFFKVNKFFGHQVSRISPSGVKSYNVVVDQTSLYPFNGYV